MGRDDSPGSHDPAGPGLPAPKPGIVSLQALRWHEIVAAAGRFIRANPAAVLVPTLLSALALFGIGGLAGWWILDLDTIATAADPAAAEAAAAAPVATSPRDLLFTLVLTALLFVVAPPAHAVVLSTLRPAVLGRDRLTLSQAFTAARPHLRALYGVWAVVAALSLIPTLIETTAAIPSWISPDIPDTVGTDTITAVVAILTVASALLLIYVSILIALAPAAAVIEGLTAGAALRRSLELVHRSWWRCFAVLAAISVIILIPTTLITVPAIIIGIGIGMIAPPWIAILTAATPLAGVFAISCSYSIGATALLYHDQRIRRENYATDLIHDARQKP
ncbi:putative integral membrane protein [Pseudonocardia sp. Ae168_Ps1]|nr:putative integral membrane protein [Pseudonocardia sp. Ae150A_Ps1]OLL70594.1 putative integral membrane protein [Pseudonocardia sp. Ae168_Ps1]OLL70820.1 putative integral membrane protein [Pseudonocardia sp. Ae263_Ps1]OLL89379.1 putative integral membrane protein [Pseudonocardia sp. Ae356_Ps1]